jgi:hypothetical protein
MILGVSIGVAHDALEDVEAGEDLDFEASLFPHFALDRVLELLARFEKSSGERPVALQRFTRTFDEQYMLPVEYDRADPKQRMPRIAPVVDVLIGVGAGRGINRVGLL